MSIVHNIIDVEDGGYDQGSGYAELSGDCFDHLTNFPTYQLAKWKKAIKTFKGEVTCKLI